MSRKNFYHLDPAMEVFTDWNPRHFFREHDYRWIVSKLSLAEWRKRSEKKPSSGQASHQDDATDQGKDER